MFRFLSLGLKHSFGLLIANTVQMQTSKDNILTSQLLWKATNSTKFNCLLTFFK